MTYFIAKGWPKGQVKSSFPRSGVGTLFLPKPRYLKLQGAAQYVHRPEHGNEFGRGGVNGYPNRDYKHSHKV